ncbi:MAG: hypothetical protein ACYC41_04175 [Bacillota bacterium]
MSGPEMRHEQDRVARLVHEAVAGLPPAPDHLWTALEASLPRPANSAVLARDSALAVDAHEMLAEVALKLSRATLEGLLAGLSGRAPDAAVLTLDLASRVLSVAIPAGGPGA